MYMEYWFELLFYDRKKNPEWNERHKTSTSMYIKQYQLSENAAIDQSE